ncbi:MAG: radical SAM protein [Planctomycetota bacterium]|nr:radical SAM protein [Planctomycetota bacterium]
MTPDAPQTPDTDERLEMAPVHDFVHKLRQPPLHARVVDYVEWQKAVRAAREAGEDAPVMPTWAPLSINLDLTTACNYACDHCIDWDILNSGISYDDAKLRASIESMAEKGLRSVILIGGGEPTVYPKFADFAGFLKDLELQVAVVTNGSRNERILQVVERFDENDWIRLSLDAGTDATFQAMHNPKKPITLEAICAGIPPIKAANPKPRVGFSYVITWDGGERSEGAPAVVENLDEIPLAARLARDHGFDYISFKPFLTRTDDGAEVMDPEAAQAAVEQVVARIRARIEEARAFASDDFAVLESINLKLLESGAWRTWTRQPHMCHMQALRQVLSPLGLWNCPAHRGVPKARIDAADAFSTDETSARAAAETAAILERFDAAEECKEVTCLYHDTNWWIENAIRNPEGLIDGPVADSLDYFL